MEKALVWPLVAGQRLSAEEMEIGQELRPFSWGTPAEHSVANVLIVSPPFWAQ